MTSPARFALYPDEQPWWSFQDYQFVLDLAHGPQRVLEFGPGSSTLALVEAGATWIDTCEDDPEWAALYEQRLGERFPGTVHVRRYEWNETFYVRGVDPFFYDLGLVDGPRDITRRPAVIRYSLERCRRVIVPLEEHDERPCLRPVVTALAREAVRPLQIFEGTGPLAGAFAVVGPRC